MAECPELNGYPEPPTTRYVNHMLDDALCPDGTAPVNPWDGLTGWVYTPEGGEYITVQSQKYLAEAPFCFTMLLLA